MTIKEAMDGLRSGHAFTLSSTVNNEPCTETMDPCGNDQFRHSVSGNGPQGGWGGVAVLPIDILTNGRWETDGWKRVS